MRPPNRHAAALAATNMHHTAHAPTQTRLTNPPRRPCRHGRGGLHIRNSAHWRGSQAGPRSDATATGYHAIATAQPHPPAAIYAGAQRPCTSFIRSLTRGGRQANRATRNSLHAGLRVQFSLGGCASRDAIAHIERGHAAISSASLYKPGLKPGYRIRERKRAIEHYRIGST